MVRTVGPTLFGREELLTAIVALLDRARGGLGGGLVCQGVAGIGKTALLQHAAAIAETQGFEVRVATGVPIESALPFGALSTLFATELRDDHLASRVPALAAALGRSAMREPPTVMAVAADVLELLSVRGKNRPVLIVVDDAQWADPSSAALVGHLARHGVADRLAVLVAMRTAVQPIDLASTASPGGVDIDDRRPNNYGGITTIELQPLTHAATLSALLAAGFSHDEAQGWALRCGGLPLAISEVARRGAFAPPDPREVAAFLPAAYLESIASLPAKVADAALCVAICSDLRVLRSLGLPRFTDHLRALEKAGVTLPVPAPTLEPRVLFRHPLLHAAVLASAHRDRERAIHRMVATALTQHGLADRAALHLASAADGPDEAAADAMSAFAQRARARGALAESAQANLRAATLATAPDTRSTILLNAAEDFFDNSDSTSAFAAISVAIDVAVDPKVKADAQFIRGRMSTWVESPAEMIRQLDEVAEAMRPIDPVRAAAALASSAGTGYLTGDFWGAIGRAIEAEQLASANGDIFTAVAANGALAWNTFLCGNSNEFEQRIEPIEELMRDLLGQGSWDGIHLAELFCMMWICAERWEKVDPLVRQLVHLTKTMGARLTAASATLMLGSLCWRQGRWEEAYALELPLLDDDTIPPVTLCWMRVLVAQLLASMGHVDETRNLVALALPVATAAGALVITAMANAALGHLELSLGNNDAALALLDRVADLTDRMNLHEPEFFVWQGDHLEALLRAGRLDEVADRLNDLSKFAEDGGRRWAKGVVIRTRAQLTADRGVAAPLFDEAIQVFEDLGMPFEVARTLLAKGGQQDRADARRLFLRLGASVWAEAAAPQWDRIERRSDPARPELSTVAAPSRLLERLTPSERNVALSLVSGRTNREIAAELHLSVKTVDHYLQSAFRRLGVRNRTELATSVASELDAPRRIRN